MKSGGQKSVGRVSGMQYKIYVINLAREPCATAQRLSRGARDVLAPKRYEAQESTHLLLVVVDELLIVLSSVSHGCLWNRKGKGGGYARKSGGKVRPHLSFQRSSWFFTIGDT